MGIPWVYYGKSINGNTYWGFMGTGILIVGTLGEFYDLWCMYIYIYYYIYTHTYYGLQKVLYNWGAPPCGSYHLILQK